MPFGIQLYSVRDHLADDAPATLRRLKEAGYDHVELFGVGPGEAGAWKAMLDETGLTAVAAHIDYDLLLINSGNVASMARALGFEDIIVPWLNLDGAEPWIRAATTLNEIGARFRNEGLRLGYHNHDHEFVPLGETTPFDILFEYAQPDNLFLELDVRWASELGGDPVAIINEFGPRCRFLHMKDRPKEGTGFTEVGSGTIEWAPIVEAGKKNGVRWYIVEQDESATDSLESAAVSAAFMKQL